jgi:tape measure domain-containing protein
MAQYTINFSTNASKTAQEILRIQTELTKVIKIGQSIKLNLDASSLSKGINITFRQLNQEIDNIQRRLSKLQIGSQPFRKASSALGFREGQAERGRLVSEPLRLRGQAQSFEAGSNVRLQKELQALQIEASQIAPNTSQFVALQQQIARVNFELQRSDKLAESIQLRENLGAFAPSSLAQLEAKLTLLRNKAREIAPDTKEWKAVNKEIQQLEGGINKVNKKPLSAGQRAGAAGGAFLYGGGMGGGLGSAVGGIAGGLMGGVPGAFAGAAGGQIVDNLGTALAGITSQAAAVQKMQRGLAMASVDAKDFAEAQAAVGEMSQKLLMPLEQTTKYFAQLRANTKEYNLSVADTKQILEGTALAIMATGGSAEDLDGAMRAVVQIMSKGGVQAEELRGQLGERFPGAVVKFAQANKMSFEELQKGLEAGTIGIREFINFAKKNYTDYAKFSEQLATAPEYAGQRLKIAFEQLSLEVGSLFGPMGAEIQDTLTGVINGIANFVKENRVYIRQFISDFGSIVGPIVKIFAQLLGVVAQFSVEVGKVFQGLYSNIRQALGMASIGEAKARLDRAEAATKGQTRPKGNVRGGGAFTELDQARQAFKNLGGQAAFDKANAPAQPTDLTFGGAGAGMSIDRAGKDDAGKASKLSKFYEDQRNRLKSELDLKLKGLEMDKIQNKISENQYEIDKALLELDYEKRIVNEGLKVAEAQLADEKLAAGDKDLKLQQLRKQAALDLANAEQKSSLDIARARQELIDKFSDATRNDLLEQSEQQTTLQALSEGYRDLQPEQQAYLDTQRFIADMHEQDKKLVPQEIQAYQARREQIQRTTKEIEKESEMLELRNRLAMAGALTPQDEMRVDLEQKGYDLFEINKVLDATALAEQAEKLKADLQGIASAIGNSFGEAFKGIITGSMTAQQALAGMFQSIASSFADMAGKMIAEYMRMQALGLLKTIFGAVAPALGVAAGGLSSSAAGFGGSFDAGIPAIGSTSDFSGAFKFANGGIASGGFTAFANGGMVTGPTLGLVGEGRYNEAIIPLPDGKSVPVQLSGGAGGNAAPISTNIVVNVKNGQAESQMSGNQGNQLARELEGAVRQVILKESRPGGLISSSR